MDFEQVMNFLAKANPDTKKQVAAFLAKDRVTALESQSLSEKYNQFLKSTKTNALIWAPTQVGKTSAMIDFIEACFKHDVPVMVSTDNKTDQCEQLYNRIVEALGGEDVKVLRVSDKNFQKKFLEVLKSGVKRYVVMCLNNASQIRRLHDVLELASAPRHSRYFRDTKAFAVVHDEGDAITKDQDVDIANAGQCASHKAWIQVMDMFTSNEWGMDIELKRVFVTATPENCCMLYNISSPVVFKLPIPHDYVGYKRIVYEHLPNRTLVRDVIGEEVARISEAGTHEVILYCVERKINQGQDNVLVSLSANLNCTVHTYNGKGVTVMFKTEARAKMFEKSMTKRKIRFTRPATRTFNIKKIPIRTFYAICKEAGENCVVTIGMDLIARGISYVGEDKDAPFTATVMVYKPGKTMHAVGIAQTVGRITGTAMPHLPRKLYAPNDVIETYIKYNQNQEKYIDAIFDEKTSQLTRDIISNLEFKQYRRSVDRPNVLKKMGKPLLEDDESEDDTVAPETDASRMQMLVRRWWNAQTLTGKILRWLYGQKNSTPQNDVVEFVRSCGSANPEQMAWHLTTRGREYSFVFENVRGGVQVKDAARAYIGATF